MDKLPFSSYDFFGNLSGGAVLISAAAFAVDGVKAFDYEFSVVQAVLVTLGVYLAGHVVASFSSFLLEQKLTRGVLGHSVIHLFNEKPNISRRRRVFGGYLRPLSASVQKNVLERSSRLAQISQPSRELFFHCHAYARKDEYTRGRLATFLNLYGMARNVSMASFLAVCLFVCSDVFDWGPTRIELFQAGAVGLILGVAMYFRYLKFYRLYTVEVFHHYQGVEICR